MAQSHVRLISALLGQGLPPTFSSSATNVRQVVPTQDPNRGMDLFAARQARPGRLGGNDPLGLAMIGAGQARRQAFEGNQDLNRLSVSTVLPSASLEGLKEALFRASGGVSVGDPRRIPVERVTVPPTVTALKGAVYDPMAALRDRGYETHDEFLRRFGR